MLAKVKPKASIAATVRDVQRRIESSEPQSLNNKEILGIPLIDLDIAHTYSHLIGKKLTNPGLSGVVISDARQITRFHLDERGASLQSEAFSEYLNGVRVLKFDKPFLVFLQQDTSDVPYFAMWLGTTDCFAELSP